VYALGGRQGLEQTVKAVFYAAIPILILGLDSPSWASLPVHSGGS